MITAIYILNLTLYCFTHVADANEKNHQTADCKSYYNRTLNKRIYTSTDVEPEFPGGTAAQQRFLLKNLKYPTGVVDSLSLQSTVIVEFIVEVDGSTSNFIVNEKSEKSQLTAVESEALRVYKQMPKWNPGKCNGKTVPVEMRFPVIVCVKEED